jgi:hypothetical protein
MKQREALADALVALASHESPTVIAHRSMDNLTGSESLKAARAG